MIIQLNQDNIKAIPIVGKGKIVAEKARITLMPGDQEVPDHLWKQVRESGIVDNEIKIGLIKELHAEVKKETKKVPVDEKKPDGEKEDKTEVVIKKSKSLKDLNIPEATKVVENCYNMEQLKKWLETEGRDSVRAPIIKRIDEIEQHGEQKTKSKKDRKAKKTEGNK